MREHKTADDARRFERGPSVGNMVRVKTELACGCEPYVDVFTFNRWLAQGMVVQRGQKAIRLPVIKSRTTTDEKTGETHCRRWRATSAVFCRCQVAPVNGGA